MYFVKKAKMMRKVSTIYRMIGIGAIVISMICFIGCGDDSSNSGQTIDTSNSGMTDSTGAETVDTTSFPVTGEQTGDTSESELIPPLITSVPSTSAAVGLDYVYQPSAIGSVPITWFLAKSPRGMTIDVNTGKIYWSPLSRQQGQTFDVSLLARNDIGSDQQNYQVSVASTQSAQ